MWKYLILFVIALNTYGESRVFTVTAYCNNYGKGCKICNGDWACVNRTADGHRPKEGVTCAASRDIPFGTKLWIPGVGMRVVQDRLSLKQNYRHVEVYFNDHQVAKKFGKKKLKINIPKK